MDGYASEHYHRDENFLASTIANLAPSLQRILDMAVMVPACRPLTNGECNASEDSFNTMNDTSNTDKISQGVTVAEQMRQRQKKNKQAGVTHDLHWI